ncbi:MAG: NERD domain-containing protein [Desulfosalsimonas sp.]
MDFTPIAHQILGTLWCLIPIVILAGILRSPWFKGIAGEGLVNLSAKFFLNKKDYHLIKNVTLPTENGSTQIDHIIVSKYGVFVVETKNMKGWIFGRPDQKMWTQKIYKQSNKFQNPLHQNHKHIKTLQALTGLQDTQVHSVIVFVGDSKFKTDMPDNVTYSIGYLRYIKSKTQPILTASEVDGVIEKVTTGQLPPSRKTNRAHVNHVKNMAAAKENSKICPKCGSPMVLRTVKKGENAGNTFWGCSNFPKCKG